ncbi:MAG TPA: hypothetical protein PKD61_29790, partial [Polyangiaceae bacterium]|nr:hypothetical protein [Polyangiaceae bacterium]
PEMGKQAFDPARDELHVRAIIVIDRRVEAHPHNVGDGNDNRVWLDLDCTFCGRIDGEILASAGGDTQRKQLDEDIVEYGHTRSVVVSGDSRLVADGHLLLEMPKRAAGVEVTISGTVRMTPGGPGQQRIHRMRLWIAD